MRKLVLFENVSADGCFASADGGLEWVVDDPEQQASAAASSATTDTVLFGRKTYEQFAAFWPHVASGHGPHGGEGSPALDGIARFLNDATKIVFSTTLTDASWKGTRIARAIDPAEITGMKQQRGGDMILFGSGTVATALTRHGLIDEYQLLVNPVLLGRGQRWLSAMPRPAKLKLVDARAFASGNVCLRYARA